MHRSAKIRFSGLSRPKRINLLAALYAAYCLLAAIALFLTAREIHAEEPPISPPVVLRSASELDYPPFALVRNDGTADGFSVDLLKAVTMAADLDIQFEVGPWAEIKEKLAAGQLDVLPLVSYSPDRDKVYDFTAPYLRMQGTVFVREGENGIRNFSDLKDKEVLVMRGDTAHEFAVREKLSDNLILTTDYAEAMKLLAAGRHDAVFVQHLVGLMLLKELQIYTIIPLNSTPETDLKVKRRPLQGLEQKFCFAVHEGDHELLSRLNEGLAIVYADGTYEDLYNKWFTQILPKATIPVASMIKYSLSLLVPILLLLAGFGIWYLRREVTRKTSDFKQSQQKMKITLENLRGKEEEIRLLLDHTVEAIYGCDLNGCCTFANSTCISMLGYQNPKEIIGRNMHCLAHHTYSDGSPYPENCCGITRAFKEQRLSHSDSEVFWRKDGSSFPVEYWSHPVYQGNAIQGCVVTFVDISERRRAEEKRQKLEMKLQQSFRMEAIGTLAGGIAHDINNILGAILGYTEMAREESDPHSLVHENLREILMAGHRARDLVRRILAFSRQTSVSEFQYLRPGSIILEVEKMLRPSIPSSIEIRLHLAPSSMFIFADPTQIHQILMNLCTNAYHAMEEIGGILDISLAEIKLNADAVAHEPGLAPGRFFELTVRDTGHGIHPEIELKIFDPFFTTKEVGKGTGMGLSMVHGIVKSHGGCITVESAPGQGTAFKIFMPAVEQERIMEEQHQDDLPTGTERILFIDDEKMLVEMSRTLIGRLGYAVTAFSSSVEALEFFQRHPDEFDLVITDQTMPGMTGGELARRIFMIRPDMPIIVCTGYSSILSEEKAKAIGIREFIVKPILKNDIAPLIRKVLADKSGNFAI